MAQPIVYQDEGTVTLYFRIGEIQSRMREDAPDSLDLSYTRTMMSILQQHGSPRHIAIIGLGGGSMPKWCYRNLPCADTTVVEINPHVVALRDRFRIPADDDRFRVLWEDGAHYVARMSSQIDVLLVDGFDEQGQPPALCSQQFYDDCYSALRPDGLMIANLCGPDDQCHSHRIRRSFGDRVLMVNPEDGDNKIAVAGKENHSWPQDESAGILLTKRISLEYER